MCQIYYLQVKITLRSATSASYIQLKEVTKIFQELTLLNVLENNVYHLKLLTLQICDNQ